MYDLNKLENPSPPKCSRQEQLSVQPTEWEEHLRKRYPIVVRRSLPNCKGVELKVQPEYTS